MAKGIVFDPTATRAEDNASPGPDAGVLAGRRIGFRVDEIWRAWDWVSEDWASKLRAAGAEVSYWRSGGRSGGEQDRMDAELNAWLATLDVAIVGLANCGSCTGWTIRDAVRAANTGIPTIAIATRNFADFARTLAARGGRSGLRVHVLPYPLNERERDEVDAVAETHFPAMLDALGATLAAAKNAA
ncbi:MAG: hypothetical protein KGN34_13625 [Sphingomonadales bacterium]|nr:hypothetical protein [Sphingomonadales bacterium]